MYDRAIEEGAVAEWGVESVNEDHELWQSLSTDRHAFTYPHLFPQSFFFRGDRILFESRRRVAVVGLRDAPAALLRKTREITTYLTESGFNIVSGYARGTDRHAHLAALKAGGLTTMVLPFGMRYIFSPHGDIQWPTFFSSSFGPEWEQQSMWISPFSMNQHTTKYTPLQRNQLVCLLSEAVVVMGASPEGGGTHHTVSLAVEMGIPVWIWNEERMNGNQRLLRKYGQRIRPFQKGTDIHL